MNFILSLLPTLGKLLTTIAPTLAAWFLGRSSGKKAVQTQDATKAAKTEAAMAQAATTRPADKQAVIDVLEKGEF